MAKEETLEKIINCINMSDRGFRNFNEIARLTKLNRNTISTALKELVKLGFITKTKPKRGDTRERHYSIADETYKARISAINELKSRSHYELSGDLINQVISLYTDGFIEEEKTKIDNIMGLEESKLTKALFYEILHDSLFKYLDLSELSILYTKSESSNWAFFEPDAAMKPVDIFIVIQILLLSNLLCLSNLAHFEQYEEEFKPFQLVLQFTPKKTGFEFLDSEDRILDKMLKRRGFLTQDQTPNTNRSHEEFEEFKQKLKRELIDLNSSEDVYSLIMDDFLQNTTGFGKNKSYQYVLNGFKQFMDNVKKFSLQKK